MDVFSPVHEEKAPAPTATGVPDARLQPNPDFGTYAPDSDFAKLASPNNDPAARRQIPVNKRIVLQIFAALLGMFVALVFNSGRASGLRDRIGRLLVSGKSAPNDAASSQISDRDLEKQKPQRQAEVLLERAVSRSTQTTNQGTPEIAAEIERRAPGWRGQLKLDAHLGQLTTAALNSNDHDAQAAAIEVQIAAYGLSKNAATVHRLSHQAQSSDHAQKIWALWTLGLLGNRGIATDEIVGFLATMTRTSAATDNDANDADTRRWAVEGLALVGTTPTIVPLLAAMHDDSSPLVRERAAASLAESGTLSREQRMAAIPQLINYTDDPSLDAQTHTWAFQALADITRQRLPNESAAWREWYRSFGAPSQN